MDSRSIRDWSALGLVNSFQIGRGARLKFCKSLKKTLIIMDGMTAGNALGIEIFQLSFSLK